jgi:hypothetical protein
MPKREHVEVDGRELAISNLDKAFPNNGLLRAKLLRSIRNCGDDRAAFEDRPLTLNAIRWHRRRTFLRKMRCPYTVGGVRGSRSEAEYIHYVLCNDKPTLAG